MFSFQNFLYPRSQENLQSEPPLNPSEQTIAPSSGVRNAGHSPPVGAHTASLKSLLQLMNPRMKVNLSYFGSFLLERGRR